MAHLKAHLGTNYVPTASERKDIQEYCAIGRKELVQLAEVVERDRVRLTNSSQRLATMQELLNPYLALLSPIRAIPPEILQEIFMACLPTRHCAIMHPSSMPLLLGRICSGWRTICLSTPALWSSVHIVVAYTDGDQDHPEFIQACNVLKLWLKRSGDCPLSISIFAPNTPEHNLRPIVDIVVPYSRRWKSLKLMPATREELPKLWSLASHDVPLLETLEISDNHYEPADEHALRFFTVPPNLRHVGLKYFQSDVSIPSCQWGQVTTLSLESQRAFFNLNASQLLELVGQCVNLTECRLGFPLGSSGGLPVASTLPTIVLSHLHTLSISGEVSKNAPFNVAEILDALLLPDLQYLRLTIFSFLDFSQNPIQVPVISDVLLAADEMIQRSSCDLRGFAIQFEDGDAAALLRCLQRCCRLTSLDLAQIRTFQQDEERVDIMPVINALADTSSSAPLCPDLLRLRVAHCDHTDAAHCVLRNLIEFRCCVAGPGLARLRKVDLSLSCQTSLDLAELKDVAPRSDIRIIAPTDRSSRAERATWGIPDEDSLF